METFSKEIHGNSKHKQLLLCDVRKEIQTSNGKLDFDSLTIGGTKIIYFPPCKFFELS